MAEQVEAVNQRILTLRGEILDLITEEKGVEIHNNICVLLNLTSDEYQIHELEHIKKNLRMDDTTPPDTIMSKNLERIMKRTQTSFQISYKSTLEKMLTSTNRFVNRIIEPIRTFLQNFCEAVQKNISSDEDIILLFNKISENNDFITKEQLSQYIFEDLKLSINSYIISNRWVMNKLFTLFKNENITKIEFIAFINTGINNKELFKGRERRTKKKKATNSRKPSKSRKKSNSKKRKSSKKVKKVRSKKTSKNNNLL